ncbi:HAD-IIIC family phosphatase [Pokkaliibacter sp. CJK22405]|uniref:HAD-IIIC family phosphatase n=1 Tax=Pokkaliibacter sp. CJK22405 TaxID=3384615 RepID=UPI003984E751
MITLASTTNLMPGNRAWQPLANEGELHFAEFGHWGQVLEAKAESASPEQIVLIWIWEDLISQELLDGWRELADEDRRQAMYDFCEILLVSVTRRLKARPQDAVLLGAVSVAPQHVFSSVETPGLMVELQQALRWQVQQAQQRHSSLHWLNLQGWLTEQGRTNCFDARNRYFASCRFSMKGLASLALWIQPLLHRLKEPARKVLVLDADNTLWGGVIGEDGLTGLQLGQDGLGRAYQDFQQVALGWQRRGVLLALASKNEEADVWRVFDAHAGMILLKEQISAAAIGWQPKSESLKALAARLNLGLEAFVFWDDNPAEREEVRANTPEVLVVEPPAGVWDWPQALHSMSEFAQVRYTREDQGRQASYQGLKAAEALKAAQAAEGGETGGSGFLKQLAMIAEFAPVAEDSRARAAQLCQKTNQFHLSLRRHDTGDLEAIEAQGGQVWMASLKDRFANHGQVAVAVVRPAGEGIAYLDTLAISCRVLGRQFEHWVMQQLAKVLSANAVTTLVVGVVTGERNTPAREFVASLPVVAFTGTLPAIPLLEGEQRYSLSVETLSQLRFDEVID